MAVPLKLWGPVVAWMAVIFVASSRSQIPYQDDVPDWFSHALVYLVLSFLFCRALSADLAPSLVLAMVAVIACILYGISDEWHQSFVPGRQADVWDVVKDAVGSSIGAVLYRVWTGYRASWQVKRS